MRKSYKGRLEEKERDAKELYKKIFEKRFYPEKTLDTSSKGTIAVSFFCAYHDLRYRDIKREDDYWNKLRKEREKIEWGKPLKLPHEEILKYYQMLKKARNITLILPFPKNLSD